MYHTPVLFCRFFALPTAEKGKRNVLLVPYVVTSAAVYALADPTRPKLNSKTPWHSLLHAPDQSHASACRQVSWWRPSLLSVSVSVDLAPRAPCVGLLILILRMPAVRRCAVLVSIAKYGRQKSENEDHYVRKRKHVYNYDYILRRMGTNKLYAHQTCARVFMHTPVLI